MTYAERLHALKMEHDADLVALLADLREGLVSQQTYALRAKGITARYERDAKRLATQYSACAENLGDSK